MGQTLFEKVWNTHVVAQDPGAPAVLYIDAHLIHEVTSPQAFTTLRERGLKVRRPDRTFATMDHAIPTRSVDITLWPSDAAIQVRTSSKRSLNSVELGPVKRKRLDGMACPCTQGRSRSPLSQSFWTWARRSAGVVQVILSRYRPQRC